MSKPQIANVQENTYQQLSAGDVVKRLRGVSDDVRKSSVHQKHSECVVPSRPTELDLTTVPEHLF